MLGLDTNILIRYLVRDDEAGYQVACGLIVSTLASGQRLAVSTHVLLECEWVLRSVYRLHKSAIAGAFDVLLGTEDLVFLDEPVVEAALHTWKHSAAEFADCLIVAGYLRQACSSVATFDRKAAELAGTVLLGA